MIIKSNLSISRELEVLLVAYDYCVLGLRGERLAQHRHISSATAARRIQQAKQAGYIREAVLNIPPDELQSLYPYLYRADLMETVHNYIGREHLRNLIVVPSVPLEDSNQHTLTNKERVGRAAAVRLLNLFDKNTSQAIGISAGRTLAAMVDEIQQNSETIGEFNSPPKCFPIFGDLLLTPLHHRLYPLAAKYASSTLAAELAIAIGGAVDFHLNLSIPAYIPQGFIADANGDEVNQKIQTARSFVESIPAYRMIFGKSQPNHERETEALITQVDTIITGIGGLENGHIMGWLSMVKDPVSTPHVDPIYAGPIYTDEERSQLESEGVVGHLCGTFITADQVDRFPEDSLVKTVNQRVLGTRPSDLQRCATRTRGKSSGGVILVADGAGKARAVASAISNRCITELICDSELAEELAKVKGIR